MRKKLLTLLLVGGSSFAMAQNSPSAIMLDKNLLNQSAPYDNKAYDGTEISTNLNRPANPQQGMSAGRVNTNETIVGTTTYDLQSNNSVQNRIKRYSDGTIALGWTYSSQFTMAFPDRGTGYNYFDGTSWSPNPTSRVETQRSGWPSITGTNAGKEFIVNHNTDVEQLYVVNRANKGTGPWIEGTYAGPTPDGNWWPRAIVGGANGETVHLFSLTYPVANGGSLYQGQDGAITYSRSLDGGNTWDIDHIVLPGMESAFYSGFSADEYNIDANGDVVAFVTGSATRDVILMKSVDNGTTWTKTVIWEHPIPLWDTSVDISDINGDGVADTISACDGALAVVIDNDDVCHVTYGNMRYLNDDITSGGLSFFPFTSGLLYWNENRGFACPEFIADLVDDNGDGEFNLPPGADIPLYFTSLTSFPSMAVGTDNSIYVSYSGLVENTDNGLGQPYRNLYIIKSSDGGQTWTEPTNIINDDFTEAIMASLDRNVDNKIRLVYQRDEEPGLAVRGDEDPIALNEIVYLEMDVTELTTAISPSLGSVACINPCPEIFVSFTTTPDSCELGFGTATVTVDSGAVAPFTYSWNTSPVQTGATATGLTARTYTVNVRDSIGCTTQETVVVSNVGVAPGLTATITETSACGENDGSIAIAAANGTTFDYVWSHDSTVTTALADSLESDFYTVFVTNDNGCIDSLTTFVNDGGAPTVDFDVTDVDCRGEASGEIVASVASASGNETFTWNNGTVGATNSNLVAGTYFVLFEDGLCQTYTSTTVSQPATSLSMSLDFATGSNAGAQNGIISVVVAGGTPPYSYTIDGTPGSGALFSGLNPGNYLIQVEDANGCTVSNTYNVELTFVSVEDESFVTDMNIYPNPVKENLTINFVSNKSENIQIRMMNMNGQLVYEQQLNHFTGEFVKVLDMASFAQGMYILQFVSDKDAFTKKIIKN